MSEEFDLSGLANSLMVAIQTENQDGGNGITRIFLEAYYEGKLLANLVYCTSKRI